VERLIGTLIAGGVLALGANPAAAAQDYPPGLFGNSRVIPFRASRSNRYGRRCRHVGGAPVWR